MSQSFYYLPDAELRTRALSFSQQINADPVAFGVTTEQAAEIDLLAQAYSDAFLEAANPMTRTRPVVTRKNETKEALKDAARRIGNLIIANPAVDDAQLVTLGLKPRIGRSRIGRPETSPLVRIQSTVGRRFELKIREPDNTRRGKPIGVAGAAIWICVGEQSPSLNDWTHIASTSRTNTEIEIPQNVEPGTRVWICAAWFNNRLQNGLPGPVVSAYVQFGGPINMNLGLQNAA